MNRVAGFILFATSLLLLGPVCRSTKNPSARANLVTLEQAQSNWQKGNYQDYFYWRSKSSPFTRKRTVTAVMFEKGKPGQRLYFEARLHDQGGSSRLNSLEENLAGGKGDSEKLKGAFPVMTMDEMMDECGDQLKNSKVDARTALVFDTKSNLLRICMVRPASCMDDCGYNLFIEGVMLRSWSVAEKNQFLRDGKFF